MLDNSAVGRQRCFETVHQLDPCRLIAGIGAVGIQDHAQPDIGPAPPGAAFGDDRQLMRSGPREDMVRTGRAGGCGLRQRAVRTSEHEPEACQKMSHASEIAHVTFPPDRG